LLSPDEEVLARPGHGRKVSAICNWLNKKHGKGNLIAWLALVPGHSYFLEKDETKAAKFLKTNLAPLLEEYLAQGYVAGFSEPVRAYLQWIESLQG